MAMVLAFFAVALGAAPAFSQGQGMQWSPGQRELGPVVLRELSFKDGKLSFRVDSGGCTDETSFTVSVRKDAGLPAGVPHYRLTIERVRADDCKALVLEGVLIELDLQKAAGLTGGYTISVENPVLAQSGESS